jgi:hypothetical protein
MKQLKTFIEQHDVTTRPVDAATINAAEKGAYITFTPDYKAWLQNVGISLMKPPKCADWGEGDRVVKHSALDGGVTSTTSQLPGLRGSANGCGGWSLLSL